MVMMHVPVGELQYQVVLRQVLTQVPIVRCAWVYVVMSYLANHLIPLYWQPPCVSCPVLASPMRGF
jgi:hypothetical protein